MDCCPHIRLLFRDTAVATEAYLRQELARLREVRKQETEDRQKQHEEALALVKEDAERLVKAKDLVCQKLNEEKEQANVDKERAEREKVAEGTVPPPAESATHQPLHHPSPRMRLKSERSNSPPLSRASASW